MGLDFSIAYHQDVPRKDIPKLASEWKKKIREAIESKLLTRPETFGKPLRRSLKGYRKLRVGDYRVVFRIEHTTVKIFAVVHRSEVYTQAAKRI